MSTVTLEEIEVAHNNVADLITKFKAQAEASAARQVTLPGAQIELKPGEHYAGIIVGAAGAPSHHLILLPGDADDVNWEAAKRFAADAGGELPTRREQSLLFANLKDQFEGAWYWSNEQHASYDDCAWGQDFNHGYQIDNFKSAGLRARAVRRLIIQ